MKRKEEKNKGKIWALIFTGLMVFSSFGIMFYGFSNNSQNVDYGSHTFKLSGDYLVTKINKTEFKIQSNPSALETVPFDDGISAKIRGSQMVYISFPVKGQSPEYASLAAYDLSEAVGNLKVYVAGGISDNNTGFTQFPIITCVNATAAAPVVLFTQTLNSSEVGVKLEGDCVRIVASDPTEYIPLKDRLVLKLIGVQ